MRQVSRTVATVALLLLILPHALRSEDEGQLIDRKIESSMDQMASRMEKNLGVRLGETNDISNAFAKMEGYLKKKNAIKYKTHKDGNSFGIYFEFPKKKKKLSDKTSFDNNQYKTWQWDHNQ